MFKTPLFWVKCAFILIALSSPSWFSDLAEMFPYVVVLLCGISIPLLWGASIVPPSFNGKLRGCANEIPKPTAFILLPFLLIIPLGFQTELMAFFLSWREFFSSFQTYDSFLTDIGLKFLILTVKLILGGLYLLFIMITSQVILKVVVDYFFIEKSPSFSNVQIQQIRDAMRAQIKEEQAKEQLVENSHEQQNTLD